MARKKSKERREELLGTMSYHTSSKRSPPFWLLIGARKLFCFSATVKVPMDREVFEDLFCGLSRGRNKFDVMAEDLDSLLPAGCSEKAFRTSTRCVVCRSQPISIRFANQRKLHYDHSECPRCQWSGDGNKPTLCQAKKTWPVDLSYLFLTFSRERSRQEQIKDGTLTMLITFSMCLNPLLI